MKKVVSAGHQQGIGLRAKQGNFRLLPIAACIAGISMAASGMASADDRSASDIQTEIGRLKQLLQQEEQALAAKGGAQPQPAADAATGTAPAADTSSAQADAKSAPAAAEPATLGEVVVHSRNRIEKLQDVPLSVSVVTGAELQRLQANDIDSITKRAANVSWNPGNQRTSSLSIRGIGKQGQTEAQDPAVGVIVDGVPYGYNSLTSSFDFTDVDTVEVTRGPQGALQGKNASLGSININTKKPSFTPSADYSVTIGQNDRVIGTLAGGGPVVDDVLAWRGSLSFDRGQGDIQNLNNKDQTYQNIDRASGKVQFLYTPTETFNARFSVDAQPRGSETTNARTFYTPTPATYADGKPTNLSTDASVRLARSWFTQDGYSYQNNYLYGGGLNAVNYDIQQGLVTGSHGASAELNWLLKDYTVTSITAYKDYHFDAVNDDATPFDIYRNAGGFWNDYKQVSQELRLSNQVGGFVDYQTGLFFMKVVNNAEYRRVWGNDAGAWFATSNATNTNGQYATLNADAPGRLLMQDSLDRLSMDYNSPAGYQHIVNNNQAAFAQANWHLSDPLTLTTGIRLTNEDRSNTASSLIKDNGNGGVGLNPVSVNNVQLGGFASNATSGALVVGANSAAQLSLADQIAHKYFGVAITGTPGAAYQSLTSGQQAQVAAAKALRQSQIGVLFNTASADPYKAILPAFVISPSYKINDNLTTYVSLQYGEKAGIAQFTNGVSNLVKAEKTTAYEWGVKSALLDRTLILNADIFFMNIKDYQQSVRVLDTYTTNLNIQNGLSGAAAVAYTTASGNVPLVQAKGLEFDGIYSGIPHTTIRFSGAYNDAYYKDFPNSAQPVENGDLKAPYQDVSGKTLPGASKYSFNVGVDYRYPVFTGKEFHTSFNTAYASGFRSDVSLSDYSWIPGHSLTDFGIGIGRADKTFDVSLIVRNLFNNNTSLIQTWNSYTPATPRWYGVQFSGKI